MRVISGKLKGRSIKGYDIDGTRPTMDRVKESLFASIQDYLEDAIVLDLFAGTGNLGIEAIRNGCSQCYFIDNNKRCIETIKDNLSDFRIEHQGIVMNKDYIDALTCFKDKNIQFDIIFVDPPYRYHVMNKILDFILRYELLKDRGIIVLEYSEDKLEELGEEYQLLKYKKYGDKFISIIQKNVELKSKRS